MSKKKRPVGRPKHTPDQRGTYQYNMFKFFNQKELSNAKTKK